MTATLKLYEISDKMQAVADALVENGGEVTPDIAAQLAELEGEFEQKVERCVLYVRNLEMTADAAKQEADRLGLLASSRSAAADSLKQYVKAEMERVGKGRVETALVVARIQKNSTPSVTFTGEIGTLPLAYVRITKSLDARSVLEASKAGVPLPDGVKVEQGTHLRVR